MLAGVNHPRTNGKLERLHGEIQCKLHLFEEIMMEKNDPMDLFMQWYNTTGPTCRLTETTKRRRCRRLQERCRPRGKQC